MCSILEDEMELFTLSKFQKLIEEQHEKVCLPLMRKNKLQEKCEDEINFVTRSGKSSSVVLSNINNTLTEAWYKKRKVLKQMKHSAL